MSANRPVAPVPDVSDRARGRPLGEQHVCGWVDHEPFTRAGIERSIGSRFRDQVRRHERCLAVGDGDRRITYGEFEAWADAIGGRLADQGCHAGAKVAVLAWQGADAVAAVVGSLLAGCVYVPLDPDEPDARLRSILERVSASAIVADTDHADRARRLAEGRAVVATGDSGAAAGPRIADVGPDAIAYIYHTSGSTGEPKGVFDNHRNVLHNVMRYTNALHIGPTDRQSLIQSPAFSGVVSSTFGALLNGAALFPLALQRRGIGTLAAWVRDERITIYHSVPSIFRAGLADGGRFPDVRLVRLEGDRALAQDVTLWRRDFEPDSVLANGLGTTETGLCRQLRVDASTVIDEGLLPVGYAIPDMDVAVLDDEGKPVPDGVAGQVAVSSRYLALGYWGRDDVTAAAFVDVPGQPGVRTYRTGDLGRRRPDGCLEYLGRRDGQFKVSGHRVEPAEVEAALVRVPGVREAAARTVEGRPGEGRLIAYVVMDEPFDERIVQEDLVGRLPPYMRPSLIIRMDQLPLAGNGKIDRAALPVPPAPSGRARSVDPLELRVAAIVESVLGRRVGVHDDFFLVGGDSLAAAVVLTELESETGRAIPSSLIARAPTAARLAAMLRDPAALAEAGSLFALRPAGTGSPLVLVHAHGMPPGYALLSRRLAVDRPVWALDLDANPSSDLRAEALAATHVTTLRSAQPEGPYLVGGFCYGGVLALEMARQLVSAGQRVELLAILGVTPFDFPGIIPDEAQQRWQRAQQPIHEVLPTIRRLRHLTGPERRAHLSHLVRARGRRLAARASPRRDARQPMWRAARTAFEAYRPEPYGGRATLVLSDWSTDTYTADPEADWAGLAAEVRVHRVPGNVHAMLRDPGASMVADILSREIGG